MDELHLFQNGGTIIGNGDISFTRLNLKNDTSVNISIETSTLNEELTILSIPRGPRLVLIASATAKIMKYMYEAQCKSIGIILTFTFSCFNIAGTNFSRFALCFKSFHFRLDVGRHDNSLSDGSTNVDETRQMV
jgi:hypothetical protein